MNTQQLRCFVCVADKLNFTKAAEELFLSVPTVTHHIKNLEEELSTLLFVRTSKTVRLTEAGSYFYADAKDILEKLDMAEKKIKKIANQNTRFFRIGCTSSAELLCIEKVLHKLKISFPDVYPQITVNDYFSLKNLFINKQLDVMLATREMIKNIPSCIFRKVKSMKNYAIVPKDSPFSDRSEISFEDLGGENTIILHPKFIPFQYSNDLQERLRRRSQTHFDIICENDQAAVLMSKCGYGISVLPEFCIPKEALDMPLVPVRRVKNEQDMEYGIAYHKNDREKHVSEFINHFTMQFK